MKTNKIFFFSLLTGSLILCLAAGCSEKSEETKPDNFQSIIGKWEAIRSGYDITKQDGTNFQSTTETKANGISIIWEFFDDGRLVVSQGGKSDEIRWSLKVSLTDKNDIEAGKLTIYSESGKAFAASIGQSGDLVYDLSTAAYEGKPIVMSLDIDVTILGPYKKNILRTVYHKL